MWIWANKDFLYPQKCLKTTYPKCVKGIEPRASHINSQYTSKQPSQPLVVFLEPRSGWKSGSSLVKFHIFTVFIKISGQIHIILCFKYITFSWKFIAIFTAFRVWSGSVTRWQSRNLLAIWWLSASFSEHPIQVIHFFTVSYTVGYKWTRKSILFT